MSFRLRRILAVGWTEARYALRDYLTNRVVGSALVVPQIRLLLLRLLGFQIGRARIKSRVFFGSKDIRIGNDSFINVGVFFDGSAQITLGERCSVGYEAMFSTSAHRIGPSFKRAGEDVSNGILIGDGVWIGARAVVLGGVEIGSGCVIAAGAVVNRDCSANGLYAGIPAKRIKDFD